MQVVTGQPIKKIYILSISPESLQATSRWPKSLRTLVRDWLNIRTGRIAKKKGGKKRKMSSLFKCSFILRSIPFLLHKKTFFFAGRFDSLKTLQCSHPLKPCKMSATYSIRSVRTAIFNQACACRVLFDFWLFLRPGGGVLPYISYIDQTDCRADTTAKGFIWANISTCTTSLLQGQSYNEKN